MWIKRQVTERNNNKKKKTERACCVEKTSKLTRVAAVKHTTMPVLGWMFSFYQTARCSVPALMAQHQLYQMAPPTVSQLS